jgi:hypothetical protein
MSPGMDGASYQALWPDGNINMDPTRLPVHQPRTGPDYTVQYSHAAFEADLPGIEPTCDTLTGAGCALIPQTDEGDPARWCSSPTPRKAVAARTPTWISENILSDHPCPQSYAFTPRKVRAFRTSSGL